MEKRKINEGVTQLIEHKKMLFKESYDLLDQLKESGSIKLLEGNEIVINRTIINYLYELVVKDENLLYEAMNS
ncbi:MAG: hypothetical protein KAR19_19950 [Bacteroidales bacterium]|nr:hypothetical protein [Bacteroidales bacterium]